MAFKVYRNREQMEKDGWLFDGDGQPKECRECGAEIEWAKSPRDKNVSIDYGLTTVHFVHCGKVGVRRGSEVESPNRARDDRRGSAVAPLRDGPGRYEQPAAPAADADHDLREAVNDLAHAVRSNTSAIMALMEMRKKVAPPAAPPRRFDEDGCPTDR
jgi:hypothetical protein